ncbi:MAG: hypothetical protein BKP49_02270 [Treponema sp. CETP13]|nr:MAG: hypothetical protein BKP49_02270 [Treponema sp. CETP13]
MNIQQYSKNSIILLLFLILIASTSCSTRIGIQIAEDSTETIHCAIQPDETLESTILSFSGAQEGSSIYNPSVLSDSLTAAGFSINQMSFPHNTGIDLTIQTDEMLIPGCTVTNNSFTWIITPETMKEIIALTPEETRSYVDLLMAPIITGEELTSQEYNNLIASMYGSTLATKLSSSVVTISFTTPNEITSATLEPQNCGSVEIKGKNAEFTLPLDKFLSLFSGVKFCIQWNE